MSLDIQVRLSPDYIYVRNTVDAECVVTNSTGAEVASFACHYAVEGPDGGTVQSGVLEECPGIADGSSWTSARVQFGPESAGGHKFYVAVWQQGVQTQFHAEHPFDVQT